jgi:hypothetical protein
MDYSKIEADIVRGPQIGQMYVDASPFVTTLARIAYREFVQQVETQFAELVKSVRVRFQNEDPYGSAAEMFADVDTGWLRIWSTPENQAHPILTASENDLFRAVHDFHGHYMTGRDFSRHGEEAAWVRHSQMFTGLARRAMTSETRGQNSAFIWINGGREFPEQKAILLPDWVSEIPERWAS